MTAPGVTYGSWMVASLDFTGKRAVCSCQWGAVRQVAVAALVGGSSQGCGGCRMTPRPRAVAGRLSPEIIAEFTSGRRRHRDDI